MPKPRQAQTEAVTVPAEDRLELLEGFVNLVSERWGYLTARRLTQKDMNEKTATESKAAREISKAIGENVEKLIKTPSQEIAKVVVAKREALKDARTTLKDARKPFNEKMTPLASIIKYCDSVAIPDSLKELGHPVVPRFSLSEWAQKAVEQTKKKA
ncbi:MAG: hypothetical protein ABSB28_05375 [Candidatus Bathyarchaeia archaeon]